MTGAVFKVSTGAGSSIGRCENGLIDDLRQLQSPGSWGKQIPRPIHVPDKTTHRMASGCPSPLSLNVITVLPVARRR